MLKDQDARLAEGNISSPDHATGGTGENESEDASVSDTSLLKHLLHFVPQGYKNRLLASHRPNTE